MPGDPDPYLEEIRARRFDLTLRLNGLATLAETVAGRLRTYEEPPDWERTLAQKMTAVREAAGLLRAAEH